MTRLVTAAVVIAALAAAGASAAPTKGDGPVSIAAAYGGVWVGFGNGSVRRIDPRTRRVGRPVALGGTGSFVHSLAAGFGSVWAATGSSVYRIDPRTMRASRVRGVPGWTPTSLAVGVDAVWVGDISAHSAVVRIDPRGARPQTIRLKGLMWLAVGPGGVWAQAHAVVRGRITGPAGPRRLVQLDARSGRPTGVAVAGLRCDQSLAVGADAVWAGDGCDHALWTLDATSGRPTGTRIPVPALGPRPVLGFGSVWVVGGGVVRVDPSTRRIVRRIPLRANVAAAGEGALWLLDWGDGTTGFVRRLDPETNRPAGRPIRLRG